MYARPPEVDGGGWNGYVMVMLIGFCVGSFGGALAVIVLRHIHWK